MTRLRLIAILSFALASVPAAAASEDQLYFARGYLRCAAFYVFGISGVTKPELKQQLQHLANQSLFSAELLMDKNRPLVKAGFDAARVNFLAETSTDEVKSDTRGFLNYMGEHCNELRKNHPVPITKPAR